ncbi:MAG: protein kinase [Anaerolineae bacterium]
MTELVGQTIGAYRVIAKLGEGGMAEVYKAYQPRLEREVALKFIRPELAANAEFRGRFEHEAKAIACLSHPNIVHIYDFGEEGNRYYLVMEYIPGVTLKERLEALHAAGKTMDWNEACRIISQIAAALDYAHQQGIIHRDVKPANIMLTPDGRALLNDFGIARMLGTSQVLTQTGGTIGTPAYMSPEQIRGDKEQLGPASDLYSLGIVLYEMLTGRVPFSADTPLAVLYKHLHDPIPLPRTLAPTLPEATEQVLLKALAKDPAERYPDGRSLTQALQASLSTPTLPLPVPRRIRTRPAWLIPAIVFAMLAMAVYGVWAWRTGQPRFSQKQQPTVKTMAVSDATATFTAVASTASSSATAAAATVLPPTSTATPRPQATPRATSASTGTLITVVQQFAAPGYHAEGLTWDGVNLWVADNSGTIFQVDTAGRTLGAFESPEVTPQGLAWDGTSFWVFTTNYGLIYRFQIEGTETRTLGSFESPARVFGGDISQELAWDGTSLWYANQFNVYRLDTSGNILSTFAFAQNVTGLEWHGEHLWLAYGAWPALSTLAVVDGAGNVRATFLAPVHGILALAWGDNTLWALGRELHGTAIQIYQLDVSRVYATLTQISDSSWQAEVQGVRKSPSLRAYTTTPSEIKAPHVAEAGTVFLVVELGLRSPEKGALLNLKELRVTDSQGYAYPLTGMALSADGGFALGEISGLIHLINVDPPALDIEFTVVKSGVWGSETTEGNTSVHAPSGAWPVVQLVFVVPEEADGLRLDGLGSGIDLVVP